MDVRGKLTELLSKYFNIGDSYAYNLTRVKSAFSCGTVGLDDFEEFDDETVADIADYLIANGVTVQEWTDVKERFPEESGMYIVTANDGHAQRVSFVQWQKKNRMWNLTGARSYWRVTHWQPMPQPQKGE